MTFARVTILLFFIQRAKEYLAALKDFDYSSSIGYTRSITSKSKGDEMNVARGLNLHDLSLCFHLLSRTDIG